MSHQNRSTATGTDAKRDEYFLHKLAKHRRENQSKIKQKQQQQQPPNVSDDAQLLRRLSFGNFRISAAVRKELLRLDPTSTGLCSVNLRERCAAHNLILEHLGLTIGTIIHGVDLANVSKSVALIIKQVLLERKVIFFRNQNHLTKDEHLAFGRLFGQLEIHPFSQPVKDYPEILRITNNNKKPAAINVWHSDVTWRTEPSLGSILIMREKPTFGGDTLFCDSHCQYEGLPSTFKNKVQGKFAFHDFKNFRQAQRRAGVPIEMINEMVTHFPIARHPVIRTHPETGKQSVYVSENFTEHIEGLTEEESQHLLTTLYQQCRIPEYQCRFQWELGSIAFWDNRACQHYASSDYFPQVRTVERVTVCGDVPFYRESEKSKL